MFDTVNFKLTAADVEGVSFIEETPCYLTDVATHQYNGGDMVVTGNLAGLKVTVNRWQVRVKDGSLCKWFLGDNFKSMGRADVQRAVERLSDELHLPMNLAAVTRLDVGCNSITQHPTEVYINHLGVLAWAKRLLQPSGLYYHRRDEILCFYDKNREQRARGEPIPDLYRGRNVLRYEQRFTHRLASVLGVPAVTGATLYDEAFYIAVVKRWRDTYNAIRKINDIQLNFQAMKTVRQIKNAAFVQHIDSFGGEAEYLAQIAEAQKRGELTAKQAHDLRQAVKAACQEREGLTVKSEAIDELNKKVAEAVKFYR